MLQPRRASLSTCAKWAACGLLLLQTACDKQQLERDAVYDLLTSKTWAFPDPTKQHREIDYHSYDFYPDGTYEIVHHTDYVEPPWRGRWNLQPDSHGQWFLQLDTGFRASITPQPDGTLRCNSLPLYPGKPRTGNGGSAGELPPFELPPDVRKAIMILTANPWKRANDLELSWDPTLVQFQPDFHYTSTYRGRCESHGRWYASTRSIPPGTRQPDGSLCGLRGDISAFSSSANPCDLRDPNYSEGLTVTVLADRTVLINRDLYVPLTAQLAKGVIWAVSSYEDLMRIRVEYEMPFRRGQPVQFDVRMTNLGGRHQSTRVTLEGFSVTDTYAPHDSRHERPTAVQEFGGTDLGQLELKPGESHAFSLNVTVPENAKGFYINAFINGSSQRWDFHNFYGLSTPSE